MSTKIFSAVKLPVEHLNEFLDLVREHTVERATEYVKALLDELTDEMIDASIPENFRDLPNREAKIRYLFMTGVDDWSWGNPFNIESGWFIYFFQNYVYAFPWGTEVAKWEWLANDNDWIEDYSYWNSHDHPKNITREEWENRSKRWKEVFGGWEFDRRLVFTTVSFADTHPSQFEILEKIYPTKK